MSNAEEADGPRPRGRRPTMKDVAELCGVSIKTVSRVVNGQGGTSQETAARILQTIDELGFRPNRLASDLRHIGASSMIGIVIEDVSNPFYGSMIRAIEQRARERGMMVLSVSSEEDPQREHELVRELIARQVAGLIIVTASSDNSYLAEDIRRGLSVVFADRPSSGVQCDEVVLDDVRASREAVEHLLRHGHRRIGVVADADHVYTAHTRVQGYREALEAHGIALDPALVRQGSHTSEDATEATHALLDLPEPPTALFTTNNRSTAGALRAIHGRDAQVALVGFDDFEFADLLNPPVTVVWHDPAALGQLAADLLFARLENSHEPPRRIVIPSRLLVRGSALPRLAPNPPAAGA